MQYHLAYIRKLRQFNCYEENRLLWYLFPLKRAKYLTTDYVGISVLIAASILTVEYHGYYCQPAAQISYMAATTVLGIIGMCIPWLEWFDR